MKYIYKGTTHSDTSTEYLINLGMDAEQIESIQNQEAFEATRYIAQRKEAYSKESDHLFLEAQFESTPDSLQAWKDKVAEIKLRYPK